MARWTDDEVQYLKENAEYGNYQEIADHLGRSYSSVKSKANKIDLQTRIKWTEQKISFLKENYPEKSDEKIAEKLGCTESAVKNKRHEIGIVNEHLWTEDEKEFLRENWNEMSDKKLAEELDRTKTAVVNERHELGIIRPETHCGKFNQGIHWTDDKIEFLKNNFSHMKWRKIADKFNTTYQAITDKARRLGLQKQDRWTESETEFLKNNWKDLSDHKIAQKLDRSLSEVMQKRSKRLDLLREDPSGNEYKWREWESSCEKVANQIWDNVLTQHTFEEGYRADIYLPEKNKVVEVKWSYYQDWGADKYLTCDGVDEVVVWCYHEVPPNSCSLPLLVRYDLFNMIEDEGLIEEIKQIKEASSYQANLETALQA
jgi:DNA-directed RNA polymerase specialized sigma24 family protein